MLGRLSTLVQLGLFSVACSLVSLATIAIGAFSQAWTPHAVQLYENARESAPIIYGRVMTYLLAGFGLLAVGITVFGPELLMLITRPEYLGASAAIAPLALAMVAMATTQITAGGISLTKRTRYFALLAWFTAVINILLTLVLVGPFGMLGAAWATAIAYVSLTLLYLVISQRLWRVAYEVHRSLTLVGLTMSFCLAAGFLPSGLNVLTIALKLGYCLAFIAVAFLLGAIDRREVTAVHALVFGSRQQR